jgi:hypothetical protein
MDYFKTWYWYLPCGAEENHENINQQVWDLNPGSVMYKADFMNAVWSFNSGEILDLGVMYVCMYVCIYLLQLDPSPVAELHRH